MLVDRMINDPVNDLRDPFFQHASSSIPRAVINHNDLLAPDRRGANCLHNLFDRILLVVTRDDDGNSHLLGRLRGTGINWVSVASALGHISLVLGKSGGLLS